MSKIANINFFTDRRAQSFFFTGESVFFSLDHIFDLDSLWQTHV